MAIEYTVYFTGPVDELETRVISFLDHVDAAAMFPMHGVETVGEMQREILKEEGFRNEFASQVWFRVDKSKISEAANAIRRFRRESLLPANSLALINGEAELKDV